MIIFTKLVPLDSCNLVLMWFNLNSYPLTKLLDIYFEKKKLVRVGGRNCLFAVLTRCLWCEDTPSRHDITIS